MKTARTLSRIAAAGLLGVAAVALSVTDADAKPHSKHHRRVHRVHHHRHHHQHAHDHAIARPHPCVVTPIRLAPRPVIVVYDRGRVDVDGFIGIAGPQVSIGIGF